MRSKILRWHDAVLFGPKIDNDFSLVDLQYGGFADFAAAGRRISKSRMTRRANPRNSRRMKNFVLALHSWDKVCLLLEQVIYRALRAAGSCQQQL